MADVESLVADFVTDISEVVKKYWSPLAGEVGGTLQLLSRERTQLG